MSKYHWCDVKGQPVWSDLNVHVNVPTLQNCPGKHCHHQDREAAVNCVVRARMHVGWIATHLKSEILALVTGVYCIFSLREGENLHPDAQYRKFRKQVLQVDDKSLTISHSRLY